MSPSRDSLETPAKVNIRKMLPKEFAIADEWFGGCRMALGKLILGSHTWMAQPTSGHIVNRILILETTVFSI